MKKLGLIVNPIAGMGGKVGLKGTDGQNIVDAAVRLGAVAASPVRAMESLRVLIGIRDQIELVTCPGDMGEAEARACGFKSRVIGVVFNHRTTAEDTRRAAKEMLRLGLDLLLFAGGDGTARDIYAAITDQIPVIGIPAGVKMHSAVFAVHPKDAGSVAAKYLTGNRSSIRLLEREIMDIDEDAYREGRLEARLFGYLKVPRYEEMIQEVKGTTVPEVQMAVKALAHEMIDLMKDDRLYIIGPGTTTRAIMQRLGLKNTLLGIDAVYRKNLIGSDLNEKQLIQLIKDRNPRIIVTIIGNQGYLFGRGNQQISPEVIRRVGKENIFVIATKEKILGLKGRPLFVDTGDPEVDSMLSGYCRVITGFGERIVMKVT